MERPEAPPPLDEEPPLEPPAVTPPSFSSSAVLSVAAVSSADGGGRADVRDEGDQEERRSLDSSLLNGDEGTELNCYRKTFIHPFIHSDLRWAHRHQLNVSECINQNQS